MTEPRAEGARFVLTNRMNLNGILSSRIIGPRESFSKYYQDLLELTDGSVPILTGAPSEELVRHVSEKVRTGPALLELVPNPQSRASGPVALARAVPFCDVAAIHLPDDQRMREHLARRYGNIHPHQNLLRVSPHLFRGTVTRNDIETAAATTPRGTTESAQRRTPLPTDWHRLDRVRGAMSAAVHAATTARTLQTAASLLPNSSAHRGWLGAYLRGSAHRPDGTPDDVLLKAVVDVLVGIDVKQAWNPVDVVRQIRNAVETDPASTPHLETIDANLAATTAVIAQEREFTPFQRTGRGLRTVKALLLVLLREDLTSLLAWPPSETGADDQTRQLAALFAGALRGLTREAVSLRSSVLDDVTAQWACGTADDSDRPLLEVHTEQSQVESHLLVGTERVRSAPIGPDEIFQALSPADQQAVAPALAALLDAHDAVTIEVQSRTAHTAVSKSNELVTTFPGDATVVHRCDVARLVDALRDATGEQAATTLTTLRQRLRPQ